MTNNLLTAMLLVAASLIPTSICVPRAAQDTNAGADTTLNAPPHQYWLACWADPGYVFSESNICLSEYPQSGFLPPDDVLASCETLVKPQYFSGWKWTDSGTSSSPSDACRAAGWGCNVWGQVSPTLSF